MSKVSLPDLIARRTAITQVQPVFTNEVAAMWTMRDGYLRMDGSPGHDVVVVYSSGPLFEQLTISRHLSAVTAEALLVEWFGEVSA